MTDEPVAPVEKAPHVDDARMRHIDDSELLAALSIARAEPMLRDRLDQVCDYFRTAPRRALLSSRRHRLDRLPPAGRCAVLDAAEDALARPVDFGDRAIGRSRLYGVHYLTWTEPWMDAYLLTGDPRWSQAWSETFNRWYAGRDEVRGDWPGLDVVWYSLGVAIRNEVCVEALEVFGGGLPDDTVRDLLKTVLGGCRWLTEEHDTFRPGNWQFVAACSLLRSAALLPEFTESGEWTRTAHERVLEHLTLDVYSDGGHLERSPGYHLFCLEHLRDAASHARAYLDLDLTVHPNYRRMLEWLVSMSTPEGWVAPFQDSPPVHVAAQAVDWDEPVPPRWRGARGRPQDEAWTGRTHHWLPGSKYVVSRTGWEPGDLYSAVNCGPAVPHELESHSHLAAMDFVLWGHGGPLAWEAGGPVDYDASDYYTWHRAPQAHNMPILAGRELGDDRDTQVELVVTTSSADLLAGTHAGWGVPVRRTFVFVRPNDDVGGYWVVHDEVGADVGWAWILHGVTKWHRTGRTSWRSAGPTGLVAAVATGDIAAWETAEGWTRYPSGDELRQGLLHTLSLQPGGDDLTMVLVPFAGDPEWEVAPGTDGTGTSVRSSSVTDQVSDRAWLRRDASGRPVRGVAWAGGVLADEHGLLLSAPLASHLHARWDGDDLVATVGSERRFTLTARTGPSATVLVNDVPVSSRHRDGLTSVDVPEAGEWTIRVKVRTAWM